MTDENNPSPGPHVGGYEQTFYELAKLMDIPAQDKSPREVWEGQMLPKLREALSPSSQVMGINWDDANDAVVKFLVGFDVEDYVSEYEWRGDEGDYAPTEQERALLTDAIYGVVSNVHEGLRKLIPSKYSSSSRLSGVVTIDLMQRIWANLYYNEVEAGNTFQSTLNEVVDWLSTREALPALSTAKDSPSSHVGGSVACPCTMFEQDETCPVGFPSLLCSACGGKGEAPMETVVALAAEMLKVAEKVDEIEDPFAAWESIELLKSRAGGDADA